MAWNLIPPCEWIDTEADAVVAAEYLKDKWAVTYDTETTGINIGRDVPLLFSVSDGVRRFGGYFEWCHHPLIKEGILENPNIATIGTAIKFDCHMAANRGVDIQGDLYDTLVLDWLYDENRWNHDLKNTARDHCGIQMREFKEVFPMFPKKKNHPVDTAGDAIKRKMSTPEGAAEAKEYAGLDAYASYKVFEFLRARLEQEVLHEDGHTAWDYYMQWEMPFTRVLFNMERRGFTIATGHLKGQIGPILSDMERIKGEIAKLAGHPINPNSTPQLRKLFFDTLNYKPIKYTKGGKTGVKNPSTDAEVLSKWADDGDIYANKILDYRGLSKTKGTYIEGPLALVDDNLKLHTGLKQHGTVTGRLSSSEPNLQNIPRPGNDKYGIREAFVAAPGKILLVMDYAQLEMRLMAHFSQDPKMIQAIRDGLDLHCYTVSLMYGVSYDEVAAAKKASNPTEWQITLIGYRQGAKATGFGLIYGIGPNRLAAGLSKDLGRLVTVGEAKKMIRGYFDIFQGAEQFIKDTHTSCRANEYVQTLLGRKRRLPGINASGGSGDDADVNANGIAAQARRQSVNSIIQGTAADIAKSAMMRCEYDAELRELGAEMLLQVHDELIFEIEDQPDIIALVKKRVQHIMENPFGEEFELSVPLPVDGDVAYTWADAK